jgi:hypothetical protein
LTNGTFSGTLTAGTVSGTTVTAGTLNATTVNGTTWSATGGLQLVKTQTIGSAVSSVTVTGAFNATYDNYRIIINGGVGNAGSGILQLQLGSVTTGYYSNYIYAAYAGGSVVCAANNNGANFPYAGIADTVNLNAQIEINSPYLTKQKMISSTYYDAANTGRAQGQCSDQNSQTAFTISINSGTMTGGTIYVYGYYKG